ncbi:hypothetical protein D3C73_1255010 [compost metagenome]
MLEIDQILDQFAELGLVANCGNHRDLLGYRDGQEMRREPLRSYCACGGSIASQVRDRSTTR